MAWGSRLLGVAPSWPSRLFSDTLGAVARLDPKRYQKLMDLFDEACDQSSAEKQQLLTRLQAEDRELAKRLAVLLKHDASEDDVLPCGEGQQALVAQISVAGIPAARGSTIGASAIPRSALVGVRVGDWLIREHLGSGGVGAVHRVEHVADGRVAAMKLLKHAGLSEPNVLERFRQEFQAISALDHDGCLRVYEQGHDKVSYYYVMEHMDGGDLRRLIGAPPSDLLDVLERIVEALAYIHTRGIVHRDLKPANVLLSSTHPPQPKLADFGIAKLKSSKIITAAGIVGSIDFLAPEQILGRPVDARTDLYALGCLLYVLFSGNPPFDGDNFERMRARVDGPPAPLDQSAAQAPKGVVLLAKRLLERDPNDRFESAPCVLREIQRIRTELGSAG
jgi:eukaryotic-like serine/threonine-protein kinase